MKLLTLWEPWATLMAIGAKRIETRDWRPHGDDCGHTVAIHAAKAGLSQRSLMDTCEEEYFREALTAARIPYHSTGRSGEYGVMRRFDFGHIIAVGLLLEALPVESIGCLPGVFDDYPLLDTPQERAFGNYEVGRYGLVFTTMVRLPIPIPWKSRQGKLLTLDNDTEMLIEDQVGEALRKGTFVSSHPVAAPWPKDDF